MIVAGEAEALVDVSLNSHEGAGLVRVETLAPILETPMGIAVMKGNTRLAEMASRAMMGLVKGGQNATILDIERKVSSRGGLGRELPSSPQRASSAFPGCSRVSAGCVNMP